MKQVQVSFLDRNGEVQYGLNWGQRDNRDPNQAYLQLTPEIYRGDFFPPKGKYFIANTDDNETIIFNRAQKDLGCALQTPENNALLGLYIRRRLGVLSGHEITKQDIEKCGMSYFTFTKIDDMHYQLNLGEYKYEISNHKVMIDEPLQVIYYGAPGTGKSFTIDDKTDDENSVRTTFHPDSDYASFVGAYKPTMENVPINSIYGESVQFATGKNGHPGTEKKIVYKYVPQAFLKAYVAAWSNLNKPYFLIIEEINRGNCAQIFGDLFQLLDRNNAGSSSYAIHADEDISQFLSSDNKGFASLSDDQKDAIRSFMLEKDNGKTQAVGQDILDGKLLLLPPNLYIWATMNTSDQSLFPIDSAFKRRWNWKYMPIEYNPLDKKTQQPIDWKFKIGDNLYSWGQFLSKINPEIYSLTESSDKQMGYFFAKADNATGIISEDVFLNKVLFYLWTDVFKDFDVSSELFKNKKANRSFRFTDFFEDSDALGNFIDNFGLDPIDNLEEDSDDPDDSTNLDDSQAKKGPSKTFVIRMEDGTIISSKKAKDALIDFVKYADIEKVRNLNIASHNDTPFISLQSDPGFDTWKKRYKHPIPGTDYYINSAWSVEDMLNKLVTRIANDLDLHIISKKIILQSEYKDETTD